MATVYARKKDLAQGKQNIEWMLKKFRNEVEKEGILSEMKKRKHYIKKSKKKYYKKREIEYKEIKRKRREDKNKFNN